MHSGPAHPKIWTSQQLSAFCGLPHETEGFARSEFARALAAETPVFGSARSAYLELLLDPHAPARSRLPAHFTTSCFVMHPSAPALLLLHHRKYQEWVHPGGHADDDWFLLRSALRECEEETGLEGVFLYPNRMATEALPGSLTRGGSALPKAALLPICVQAFAVSPFPDLAAHTHFDHIFRFRAPTEQVRISPAESLGFRWVEAGWFRAHLASGEPQKDGVTLLTSQVCLRAFEN